MHEEIVVFADRMMKIIDNTIEVPEIPYTPHDMFLAGSIVGFEREREDATKVAARLVNGISP